MAASSNGSSSRRDQLRAAQAAARVRVTRRRRVLWAVCALVVLGLIAVVTTVVVTDQRRKQQIAADEAGSQVEPPNALPDKSGILANPKTGDPTKVKATITIHEDYQCPGCGAYARRNDATLTALAEEGVIRLEYHTHTFVDKIVKNDSSVRAARAAACADVVGAYPAYHAAVFSGQPAREGEGYTNEQLRGEFAAKAQIKGDKLASFTRCYDGKQTATWVRTAEAAAQASFRGSTPQYDINGKSPIVVVDGQQRQWYELIDGSRQGWLDAITKYT